VISISGDIFSQWSASLNSRFPVPLQVLERWAPSAVLLRHHFYDRVNHLSSPLEAK